MQYRAVQRLQQSVLFCLHDCQNQKHWSAAHACAACDMLTSNTRFSLLVTQFSDLTVPVNA